MGYATTRTLERVAAALGELESAPIQFQTSCDVAGGGVLLGAPALLAAGLLRHRPPSYQLPAGFYGLDSVFLLLALMAPARVDSLEGLRYAASGEWGKLLGLDRAPEVRTLRAKVKLLCPEFFARLWEKRIAVLTYRKFPQAEWRAEEFTPHRVTLAGGQSVTMKLAERGAQLSNRLWLREVRKLTESGHQTALLTTDFQAPMTALAVSLFARWSQENFFRYMREHYSLDRLVEYGTEVVPDAIEVVNPQWRELDSQIRSKNGRRQRLVAEFGALALSGGLSEEDVQDYEQRKGQLQEQIQCLELDIAQLKAQRGETAHHIPVKSLPEEERFTRLRTERKHFVHTIKMIAYRAETSLVSLLREGLARSDDARALIRQIFEADEDLLDVLVEVGVGQSVHHQLLEVSGDL
jgi:hypothetical protein